MTVPLKTHCEYWKSSMFFNTGRCTLAKETDFEECSGIIPLCVIRIRENAVLKFIESKNF